MNKPMIDQTQKRHSAEPLPIDSLDLPPLRVVRTSKRKAPNAGSNRRYHGEEALIALLLVYFVVAGSLGVVYVAAFARVEWQAQQMTHLDDKLKAATARHDMLVKYVAYLSSDHRISQAAGKLEMSQGGSSEFVDIPSAPQVPERREIASAL